MNVPLATIMSAVRRWSPRVGAGSWPSRLDISRCPPGPSYLRVPDICIIAPWAVPIQACMVSMCVCNSLR